MAMANAATDSGAVAVTMVIESRSPHETKSWGRRLASILEGGELLGLIGDLGAGKTCFIKGLARGLSLREEDILSPTFTMIQEHHGRLPLYHIDLYRLEEATLDDLGLREYLFSGGARRWNGSAPARRRRHGIPVGANRLREPTCAESNSARSIRATPKSFRN